MTLYTASFGTILLRFYAMMGIGIAAIVTGYYALGALCLPLLMMCMLGLSFKNDKNKTKASVANHRHISKQMDSQAAA